jgi:hypothetical protein
VGVLALGFVLVTERGQLFHARHAATAAATVR